MKKSISAIAKPISFIINQSLEMGRVPDFIKIAKVVPIFKNGLKSDITSYRPISVLPSFSKVYEKVVSKRLNSFCMKNNIINEFQCRFRPHHSTHMALLHLYDRLTEAIEANEFTVGVFVDLQKAFDTIDHGILLKKLEHYGMRGVALEWIKCYLTNRKQCVKLNGVSSSYKCIECGVPQGSILGPLLFIVYINDIQNCSNVLQFILFADDTNIIASDKNWIHLENKLNTELSKLTAWFNSNKLPLNVKRLIIWCSGQKKKQLNHNDLNIN